MVKQIICVSFRRKSEDDTPHQAAECRAVSKFQFVCKNINTVEEMAHWNTFLFYRYLCEYYTLFMRVCIRRFFFVFFC
jgi:hypothetical protein